MTVALVPPPLSIFPPSRKAPGCATHKQGLYNTRLDPEDLAERLRSIIVKVFGGQGGASPL